MFLFSFTFHGKNTLHHEKTTTRVHLLIHVTFKYVLREYKIMICICEKEKMIFLIQTNIVNQVAFQYRAARRS